MKGANRKRPALMTKALAAALAGAMVSNGIGAGALESYAAETAVEEVRETAGNETPAAEEETVTGTGAAEGGAENSGEETGRTETETGSSGEETGREETDSEREETDGAAEETDAGEEVTGETEEETDAAEEEAGGTGETDSEKEEAGETEENADAGEEVTGGAEEETEAAEEENDGAGSEEEETEKAEEETDAAEGEADSPEAETGKTEETGGAAGSQTEEPEKAESFTVEYSYDEEMGTVKGPKRIDRGDSLYFTVFPKEGNVILSVTANGMDLEPVGAATPGELSAGDGRQSYLVIEAEENLEIEVDFAEGRAMKLAEIPEPNSVGAGVDYKEMSEFVVPDMENIEYGESNGTMNFKMNFQIQENDEDELTVVLDDAMLYGLENYPPYLAPGMVFNWDFTFDNQSGNSYRYKEGSLVVAPADLSSLIEEDYEKYGPDFPHAAGYDGQLIPSIYSKHRCKDSEALEALFGKNTEKINLEDMLQIYDRLAEKGYAGDEALTDYYLDFYNEKYGTSAGKIIELPEAAQDDIMAREGGYNGIFSVSGMEEIEKLNEEYEYFQKYALVNTGRMEVELLEIEPQLASLIYDDWYNASLGITVGERAEADMSKDPAGCGDFGIGKYMTGLSDVWDEADDRLNDVIVLDEMGESVLPIGLLFNLYKIGNVNQNYPVDFYVAFELERVITEGSLTINKVDDDGNLIDLPAAFKLYKLDGDRKLFYTGSEWSEDEAQGAEYVTSAGTVTIPSLDLGVYYIQEVKAPEGYELVSESYQVNLDSESVTVNFSNKIQYTIIINYYEKDTGAKLADSYTSEAYTRGEAYDVTELIGKVIDGYDWDSCDQSVYAGEMSGNLIFNVYYTKKPSGSHGGGGNSGGSGGGGPRNPYNPGGGPGVNMEIDPEEVPLADLPEEASAETPVEIPGGEVPLSSLPKTGQDSSAGKWMMMIAGLIAAVYALAEGKRERSRNR